MRLGKQVVFNTAVFQGWLSCSDWAVAPPAKAPAIGMKVAGLAGRGNGANFDGFTIGASRFAKRWAEHLYKQLR